MVFIHIKKHTINIFGEPPANIVAQDDNKTVDNTNVTIIIYFIIQAIDYKSSPSAWLYSLS